MTLHNLVLAAALVGRRPVIPTVPCEFVRAVQSQSSEQSRTSRFGISHAGFVTSGTAAAPVCHLAPATWRHTGAGECHHGRVLHQADFDEFKRGVPQARAPTTSHHATTARHASARRRACHASPPRRTVPQAEAIKEFPPGVTFRPSPPGHDAPEVEAEAAAAEGAGRAAGRGAAEDTLQMLESMVRLCSEASLHADEPLLEYHG